MVQIASNPSRSGKLVQVRGGGAIRRQHGDKAAPFENVEQEGATPGKGEWYGTGGIGSKEGAAHRHY
jgi:hypothetical protein